MEPCKQFQDIILTEYFDGELDQPTKAKINEHLANCPACFDFAAEVKRNLITPFSKVSREEVPSHVWSSIKNRIENESSESNWFQRLLQSLTFPQLTPVLGSLIVIVLVSVTLFHNQQIRQAKDKAQGDYLVSIVGSSGLDNGGLGTPLEEYFL
jgi:anti-sigma factor RsiW